VFGRANLWRQVSGHGTAGRRSEPVILSVTNAVVSVQVRAMQSRGGPVAPRSVDCNRRFTECPWHDNGKSGG